MKDKGGRVNKKEMIKINRLFFIFILEYIKSALENGERFWYSFNSSWLFVS
jgi:hypothetical protein